MVAFPANMPSGPGSAVTLSGKNFSHTPDSVPPNTGMPLSPFGIAIAAAWVAWPVTSRELQSVKPLSDTSLKAARLLIGVLAPVFVAIVALGGIL